MSGGSITQVPFAKTVIPGIPGISRVHERAGPPWNLYPRQEVADTGLSASMTLKPGFYRINITEGLAARNFA
jgi:hypothetical protein